MTNTESRVVVGLEELAASDDEQALDPIDENLTAADIRELDAYAFDSEHRTLVGLGPVERARRSRRTTEIPDSQRMPQSEPPGPFIANDDEADDEELARALRGRKLGPWSLAVPTALALAAAALALVRGLASPAPTMGKPVLAAGAAQATEKLSPKVELTPAPAPPPAVESSNEREPAQPDPAQPDPAQPAVVEPAPRSSAVAVPVAPPALPVKLPELTPPTVIDMSPGAGESVGTLDISSSPPANVVLDGRPLGKAPRLVHLPPGAHTVLFIHPLYGRQSLSVNVSSGHTTQASADF
jgi:hypothetical protein